MLGAHPHPRGVPGRRRPWSEVDQKRRPPRAVPACHRPRPPCCTHTRKGGWLARADPCRAVSRHLLRYLVSFVTTNGLEGFPTAVGGDPPTHSTILLVTPSRVICIATNTRLLTGDSGRHPVSSPDSTTEQGRGI